MSIVRGKRPESGWYALNRRISEDPRLGWAARGLLVYLLGKPDDWRVSVTHLRKQTEHARISTGRDGIYTLLEELRATGYVTTRRDRRANGTLGQVDYIVTECPLPAQPEVDRATLPAQPLPAQPCLAMPTLHKTEVVQRTEKRKEQLPPTTVLPELPDWIDRAAWERFVAMRNNNRSPLTSGAAVLVFKKLSEFRSRFDPNEVLDQSTRNGWRDVYPIRCEEKWHRSQKGFGASPRVNDPLTLNGYEGTPKHELPAELRDDYPNICSA